MQLLHIAAQKMQLLHVAAYLNTSHILCTITVRVDNTHAKSSCVPPNQYKASLCTTKVYVGTELYIENLDLHVHCQPQKYILCVRALVHHLCIFVVNPPYKMCP